MKAVGAKSILGNVGAVALLALVLLLLYGSRLNPIVVIGDVFGYEVQEKVSLPPGAAGAK